MTTMRQIQLTEWGDESVLHEANVPIPSPVRGHVLIKTVAAGVNLIDVTTRKGLGPAAQLADPSYKPFVPGWDVAGTVVATAGDYTGFKVGDGVFGLVAFPSPPVRTPSMFSPLPSAGEGARRCSLRTIGRRSLAALTAYQALFEVARLKEGERVLIHAGAGGVTTSPFSWRRRLALRFLRPPPRRTTSLCARWVPSLLITAPRISAPYWARPWMWCSIPPVSRPSSIRWRCWFPARIVTLTSPDPLDVARERGFEAQWLTVHPDRTQMQEIARLMSLNC